MLAQRKLAESFMVLATAMLLGGCQSLMMGKQYVFPKTGEPSATVRVDDATSTRVDVMTLNEEGCYAGITPLPYKGKAIDAQVAPGKELVLAYNHFVGSKVCRILLGLTPEENAIYTIKSGSWSELKTGILPIFTHEQEYCGLAVSKKVGEVESVEPAQQLVLDTGIICHKFAKRHPPAPAKPEQ